MLEEVDCRLMAATVSLRMSCGSDRGELIQSTAWEESKDGGRDRQCLYGDEE